MNKNVNACKVLFVKQIEIMSSLLGTQNGIVINLEIEAPFAEPFSAAAGESNFNPSVRRKILPQRRILCSPSQCRKVNLICCQKLQFKRKKGIFTPAKNMRVKILEIRTLQTNERNSWKSNYSS